MLILKNKIVYLLKGNDDDLELKVQMLRQQQLHRWIEQVNELY